MNPGPSNESKIAASWDANALPWTNAVRTHQIESRTQVTDQAIVDAIVGRLPRSVLDIGCGEGWLARELAPRGIHVIGVDGAPALVEAARRASDGDFRRVSYAEIADGKLQLTVDLAVCNFALLGKASVEGLFGAVRSLLNPGGAFVVQTLHPRMACGELRYRDGWREGSWAGFGTAFSDPAPWYFRTVESWLRLFADSGFQRCGVREPIHPQTQKPASIIFIGEANV